MIERELKFALDSEKYESVRKLLRERCGEGRQQVQCNYYYDTRERELAAKGVTLRIRQKGDRLQGQIKRHNFGGSAVSREEYFPVDKLPAKLKFEGHTAKLLGSLTTLREKYSGEGWEADLDLSYYLGQCDRELEIEFSEDAGGAAVQLAETLGLDLVNDRARGGKYTRFLKALEGSKSRAVNAEGNSSQNAEIG